MIKWIKAIFRFIIKRENIGVALKMASIGSDLYSNFKPKQSKKIRKIVDTLKVIQMSVDTSQSMTDNKETAILVSKINSDKDNNKWGTFTAEYAKDKHGQGNDGINLGIKTKIFDKDLKVKYDPKDGSASVEFGVFKINM